VKIKNLVSENQKLNELVKKTIDENKSLKKDLKNRTT